MAHYFIVNCYVHYSRSLLKEDSKMEILNSVSYSREMGMLVPTDCVYV